VQNGFYPKIFFLFFEYIWARPHCTSVNVNSGFLCTEYAYAACVRKSAINQLFSLFVINTVITAVMLVTVLFVLFCLKS